MLKYFIKGLLLLGCIPVFSQSGPIDLRARDTTRYSQPYGLRAGIDLSRPALSFFNEDYTGLEIVADYRLTQRLYLAGELGNEQKTNREQLENFDLSDPTLLYEYETSGSYIKLGVDYNTYENWYGMNNSIFIGGRYAFSTFSQTLNSAFVYDSSRYWVPNAFATGSQDGVEYGGLNASWLEFLVGVKAELFANFYLGASVRLGFLVSNKEADNFPNLWIPGFNRVTDGSNFGVGYNYSITYFLPLYRKAKKGNSETSPAN
ncbi:DUF6048 family protein [Muriicola marianensis]|uniref:Outer membrane beta-barrel protein n=1 Tax=Muriicola marianensis TaxID=1324801 RepID=A0ABQ1QMP6_9FLAO|nr:DUF6048 family protein [Muriicola marianensis]GGD36935.1 hypothetical protein GCM10011361_00060 [Muriicola marianensis]